MIWIYVSGMNSKSLFLSCILLSSINAFSEPVWEDGIGFRIHQMDRRQLYSSVLSSKDLRSPASTKIAARTPSISDFYDFKLGIKETELLAVLKSKGFQDILDSDASTFNGKLIVDIRETTQLLESRAKDLSKETLFCIKSKFPSNAPTVGMKFVCQTTEHSVSPIFHYAFDLYKNQVIKIDFLFNPTQAKDSFKGVLGKFGMNFDESPIYAPKHQLTSAASAAQKICLQSDCDVRGWWDHASNRWAALLVSGGKVDGSAVLLRLVDSKSYIKFAEEVRSKLDSINKTETQKLGF